MRRFGVDVDRRDEKEESETQSLLRVLLARTGELSAEFKGMRHEIADLGGAITRLEGEMQQVKSDIADLKSDVTVLKTDLRILREESAQRYDSLDSRLEWLATTAMEHGADIMQLKRRQA